MLRANAALTLILLAPLSTFGAMTVKTVEVDSPSVGRKLQVNVALPADYERSGDKRYAVVYLLHGYSGNFTNWERNEASKAAEGLDLILVMPDGGNSWYVNWSTSEEDQKNAWDDFISKDLINYVDSNYCTVAKREGRAIYGLSMGGYGAMIVGLRHPDLYAAVGSSSGALAFAEGVGKAIKEGREVGRSRDRLATKADPRVTTPGFSSQAERTPKGKIFAKVEDAEAYDPFLVVLKTPKEKLPHLFVDCGVDDSLLDASRRFAKVLMANKIAFTYSESPGKHDRAYWTGEIHEALVVLRNGMRKSSVH